MSGTQQTAFGGSRRQVIAANATGAATAINLNWLQTPFNASFIADLSSASGVTYSVQSTYDDLNDAGITSPTWLTDSVANAATETKSNSYTAPIKFLRLNVGTAGTGTIYFTVLQGMNAE